MTGAAVQIHAHRGGAADRPEKTIAAFKCAVSDIGADSIELDVHPTADHKLVIHHDFTINPALCLDPNGNAFSVGPALSTTEFAEIRRYDCGTPVGLPKGTRMPTLDEVFNAVEPLRTPAGQLPQYDLHVKWDPATISASDYVTLLLAAIARHGVMGRLNFMNDTQELLTEARNQEPALSLYYMVATMGPGDYALAANLKVAAVAVNVAGLNQAMVKHLHDQGFKVIPWTVDSPFAWADLAKMGVDGILTDDPLGLKQLLFEGQSPASIQSHGFHETLLEDGGESQGDDAVGWESG